MQPPGGTIARLILLTLGLAVAPLPAPAADKERGTFTLQFENDLFYGADRHYTNGLRGSWVSPPHRDTVNPVPWVRGLLEWLSLKRNNRTRLGLALAQEMYTPADRRRTDLILDDRPYAGWLYGAMSLHTVSGINAFGFAEMLDSIELNMGIVGPHAYGQQAQDLVHDIRVIDRFDGWRNQLKDEPGLLLMYERKWRGKPRSTWPANLEFDMVPHMGASIGNVLSHVNLGGAFRYGYHLPWDFGPPSLIKGMRTLDARRRREGWSWYGFAGAEGRYVAHNIFLDGNTWRRSHSVDREPLVADLSLGLAFERGPFKIAYTGVLRTREFAGQPDNTRFGSISLSWQWN